MVKLFLLKYKKNPQNKKQKQRNKTKQNKTKQTNKKQQQQLKQNQTQQQQLKNLYSNDLLKKIILQVALYLGSIGQIYIRIQGILENHSKKFKYYFLTPISC